MIRTLFAVATLVALSACAGQPGEAPVSPEALARDGRDIAEAQCSRCHAVGEYGESPNVQAPAFRTVLSRYRAEVLQEELIEGIRVNHQMPDFQFNPQGADALIAYMRSIQAAEPAS